MFAAFTNPARADEGIFPVSVHGRGTDSTRRRSPLPICGHRLAAENRLRPLGGVAALSGHRRQPPCARPMSRRASSARRPPSLARAATRAEIHQPGRSIFLGRSPASVSVLVLDTLSAASSAPRSPFFLRCQWLAGIRAATIPARTTLDDRPGPTRQPADGGFETCCASSATLVAETSAAELRGRRFASLATRAEAWRTQRLIRKCALQCQFIKRRRALDCGYRFQGETSIFTLICPLFVRRSSPSAVGTLQPPLDCPCGSSRRFGRHSS